jgi:hypothetical protein
MSTGLRRGLAVVIGSTLCLLAAGLPASAAAQAGSARPTHRPTVTYFRASAKALPSSGGTFRLSAAVRNASECAFSVSPKVAGFPAKVPCGRGSASRAVRLPANSAAAQKSYKFGLTVTGRGGKATARPVTVAVLEAPPAITQVAASPADFPSAGGTTVLSAAVTRSAKCTLSVTPAVAGLPVTKACSAGSTPGRVSFGVTLPALSGAKSQKYSLTLTVTGPGGRSTAASSGTVWSAMTFSAPVRVDSPAGWLGTVSCVSATFCMGIDLATGAAESWNGTTWSAPTRLETGPYADSGYQIHVSCSSISFCLAADATGNAWTFDGTTWSATGSVSTGDESVTALSCVSPTFCMAGVGAQESVFNGSTWSAPLLVASDDDIESVSCPSDTFCMAVTKSGTAYRYTSSGWDSGYAFDTPYQAVSVSCASAAFCVAVGVAGQAVIYSNGTWSAPSTLNNETPMDAVSCVPGTSFCMALSDGSYFTTDGTTWTLGANFDPGNPSVLSCVSATDCMVTDGRDVFVVNASATTWTTAQAPGGPLHGFPYSISCPTATFCLAVDWSGAYLVYNGKTWSSPKSVSTLADAVDSVSCLSATFCMAVDASDRNGLGGNVFVFNGRSWTWVAQDGLPLSSVSCTSTTYCEMLSYGSDGSVYSAFWNGTNVYNTQALDTYQGFGTAPGQGELSCASRNFCVAVDQLGNAFTYNGSTWSGATALDPGFIVTANAVSCPTTTFCVATDAGGHEYTFNGTSWTAAQTIDSAGVPQAVSCTSTHFCAVADLSGNVATFNGTTWSGTTNVDPVAEPGTGLTGISCADAAQCVAVDWEGNALTGTG